VLLPAERTSPVLLNKKLAKQVFSSPRPALVILLLLVYTLGWIVFKPEIFTRLSALIRLHPSVHCGKGKMGEELWKTYDLVSSKPPVLEDRR
jgi:hypothetical protein